VENIITIGNNFTKSCSSVVWHSRPISNVGKMSGPDCNRTLLTMPSTSGADACVPAFGLEEELPRIWFVKCVENLLIYR